MNLRSLLAGPASGYIVSTVTVVGAVVLAALGRGVPDQLWTLAATGLGAGVGATVPGRATEPASPAPAAATAATAAAAAVTPGV